MKLRKNILFLAFILQSGLIVYASVPQSQSGKAPFVTHTNNPKRPKLGTVPFGKQNSNALINNQPQAPGVHAAASSSTPPAATTIVASGSKPKSIVAPGQEVEDDELVWNRSKSVKQATPDSGSTFQHDVALEDIMLEKNMQNVNTILADVLESPALTSTPAPIMSKSAMGKQTEKIMPQNHDLVCYKKLNTALKSLPTRKPYQNIQIYDVPVLQQADSMNNSWGSQEQELIFKSKNKQNYYFVRLQEMGNSAYHALKNCMIMINMINKEPRCEVDIKLKQLLDQKTYFGFLRLAVPTVYAERLRAIKKAPSSGYFPYLVTGIEENFNASYAGNIRTDYVDLTEFLALSKYPEIVVLDKKLLSMIAQADKKLFGDLSEDPLMNEQVDKMLHFKQASQDVLATVLKVRDNHYVSCVMLKLPTKIIVYYMDSMREMASFIQPEVMTLINVLCV